MTPLNTTPPQPPLLPAKTATRVRTKTVAAVAVLGLIVAAAAFASAQSLRKRYLPQRTIYRIPPGYAPGYTSPGYTAPGYAPVTTNTNSAGRRDGR